MKQLLFLLLIPSVLLAQDQPAPNIKNILSKYKNIKEEMRDRKAIVTQTDGVIFADVGLNYPVHKLEKGQVLNLADWEVKIENVFPVLINGGVGYVRAGDIKVQKVFSSQAASRLKEHNIDFLYEEHITNLDGRTSLLVKYDSFSPGKEWSNFNELAGDRNDGLKGYQFLIEFQPRGENMGFGIGPSHYKADQSVIKLSTWAIEGQAYFSPARWSLFQWDLHVGGGFSSGLTIEVEGVEGVNTGYFYSYNVGTTVRILPDYKIGGVIGANYRVWKISGMKEVIFPGGGISDLNGLSGTDFFIGLSYKFL